MVGLIVFAAFMFQPIRNWIQEQLDRYYFYKDRYDYRRTLIEFAQELGSETNLDEMLRARGGPADPHAVASGTSRFSWPDEADDQFQLQHGHGQSQGSRPENVALRSWI